MLTRDELLALLRRGDLGRARDVYLLLGVLEGDTPRKLMRLSVEQLSALLGVSYSRAKKLRRAAIRLALIHIVGRSECRRNPPAAWRRIPLQGTQYGSPIETQYGSEEETQYGSEGPNTGPEAKGPNMGPAGGAELGPPDPRKAVEDPYGLKKRQTEASLRSVCLSHTQSESTAEDPNTNNIKPWAFAQARAICQRLQLQPSDANGIASELVNKAQDHWDGPDRGKLSVLALVDQLAGESDIRNGGHLIGALRNRWAEWTSGGGGRERERWRSPEGGAPDRTPEERRAFLDSIRARQMADRAKDMDRRPKDNDIRATINSISNSFDAGEEPQS